MPSAIEVKSERNIVQDLAITIFSVLRKNQSAIVDFAVHEIAKRVEDKVQPQPGLFLLDSEMRRKCAVNITDVKRPFLLFIHGTNSNTEDAFRGLKENRQLGLWNYITSTYGENILSFDHKTFTQSPLKNALELLQSLPADCTIHLITHIRGGLIGDILARVNAGNINIGFNDAEMKLLAESSSSKEYMEEINALAATKNIHIQKFIRVASPSMGTSLLSDRLDHYLNAILNLIGIGTGFSANPAYAVLRSLVAEVVASKSKVDVLPCIEATMPDSPFIKMLNNPVNTIDSPLTVISGNCTMHLQLKALLVILTKLYFRHMANLAALQFHLLQA